MESCFPWKTALSSLGNLMLAPDWLIILFAPISNLKATAPLFHWLHAFGQKNSWWKWKLSFLSASWKWHMGWRETWTIYSYGFIFSRSWCNKQYHGYQTHVNVKTKFAKTRKTLPFFWSIRVVHPNFGIRRGWRFIVSHEWRIQRNISVVSVAPSWGLSRYIWYK